MKKIVTLLLTAALAVAAATTACADTKIEPGPDSSPNPASGDMNVTYKVNPSYTVTIPGIVELKSTTEGAVKGTATVGATGVTIPKGQAVQVKLSTDFTATSGEGKNAATLKYKVKKGNDEVANEGAVLTVTSGSGSTDLTFELAEKVTYSGTYTDTVKFIVSVG